MYRYVAHANPDHSRQVTICFCHWSPRDSLARLPHEPAIEHQHTFNLSVMVSYCACGCGQKVSYGGHYRSKCLPAGKKNSTRPSNIRRKKNRLAVRNAGAVEDIGFPALTDTLRLVSTSQAILDYDEKFLQFRKQNEGKGVIVVSIAVTAEGLHPSGRNAGKSIVEEMKQASLWNGEGMANIVRLVTRKGIKYYENPTYEEMSELGAPGELLFDAEGNRQLAMHVEKVMQVYVLHCEMIAQEKIKLLQLTAGNGSLKQGSPFKVGVCFFLSETIKKLQFVFKDNLSNKQLKYPKSKGL